MNYPALFAFVGLAATGQPLHAEPAAASKALLVVGKITDVTPPNAAEVVHRDGGHETAVYGMLLRAGDRFEFLKPGEISANVHGRRMRYTPGTPDRSIPARDIGGYSALDSNFFDRFRQFLSQSREAIQVYPWVRGKPAPQALASPGNFAPPGRISIPRGTKEIALVWRAGPATLSFVTANGSTGTIDSGANGWAVVKLPERIIKIQAEANPSLQWSIDVADRVPGPPWLLQGATLSEAERLVRATWLLSEGPREWRVFAVSELASLSAGGNFPATELWTAARSDELAKMLWK